MKVARDSEDVPVCFFFKQKTAYEVRISDWSSDVCSSDLVRLRSLRRVWHCRHATQARERDGERHSALPVRQSAPPDLHQGQAAHEATHEARSAVRNGGPILQIGRASCRERVCQYVSISVVAVSLKKHNKMT